MELKWSPSIFYSNLTLIWKTLNKLTLKSWIISLIITVILYKLLLASLLFIFFTLTNSNQLLSTHPFLTQPKPNSIPKLIHQLHPPKLPKNASIEYWKTLHPDYTHRLWTDSDLEALISKDYGWLYKKWRSLKMPIQKADLGRYVVVYHFGGFYADLDCFPLSNINELTSYEFVIIEGMDLGGFTNWFFGASQGSPFLKKLLEDINQSNDYSILPYVNVMISSGVLKFTHSFYQYASSANTDHIFILRDQGIENLNYNYVIHEAKLGRSWHKLDGLIISWFGSHLAFVQYVAVHLTAVALGWLFIGKDNLCVLGPLVYFLLNCYYTYFLWIDKSADKSFI